MLKSEFVGASSVTPKWNFYKYLINHHGDIVQVWGPDTSVADIFDAVEATIHDADLVPQVESPLAHIEL